MRYLHTIYNISNMIVFWNLISMTFLNCRLIKTIMDIPFFLQEKFGFVMKWTLFSFKSSAICYQCKSNNIQSMIKQSELWSTLHSSGFLLFIERIIQKLKFLKMNIECNFHFGNPLLMQKLVKVNFDKNSGMGIIVCLSLKGRNP